MTSTASKQANITRILFSIMGRTKAKIYEQPDTYTCGPAALKTALHILGKRRSFAYLKKICRTSKKDGTSEVQMIKAANLLGLSVMMVEHANLRHLQSALKYRHGHPRVVIVDWLQDLGDFESGHWSTVASYSSSNSRIVLFDPSYGARRSYKWKEFASERWIDYHTVKTSTGKLRKKWNKRMMLVLAPNIKDLPSFKTKHTTIHPPVLIKRLRYKAKSVKRRVEIRENLRENNQALI
jgi:ABC-type bacteriocin/lantibiotic exporter with double-glycine peptidase domain